MEAFISSIIAGAALLIGALIGTTVKLSKSQVSVMQHLAAGIIFAAVAVELIPKILAAHQKLDIAIGFLLGLGAMLLIRKFGEKYEQVPVGLITGIGVDLWIDGLLIALSFVAAQKSGIVITSALCVEAFFLGMALLISLKNHRFLMLILLALAIPFGTGSGLLMVHILPEIVFEGALSFGVAALLFLVTEELLVEAHKEVDSLFGSAAFFIGFLLILLLS